MFVWAVASLLVLLPLATASFLLVSFSLITPQSVILSLLYPAAVLLRRLVPNQLRIAG